jgi:hypothetical protein
LFEATLSTIKQLRIRLIEEPPTDKPVFLALATEWYDKARHIYCDLLPKYVRPDDRDLWENESINDVIARYGATAS